MPTPTVSETTTLPEVGIQFNPPKKQPDCLTKKEADDIIGELETIKSLMGTNDPYLVQATWSLDKAIAQLKARGISPFYNK